MWGCTQDNESSEEGCEREGTAGFQTGGMGTHAGMSRRSFGNTHLCCVELAPDAVLLGRLGGTLRRCALAAGRLEGAATGFFRRKKWAPMAPTIATPATTAPATTPTGAEEPLLEASRAGERLLERRDPLPRASKSSSEWLIVPDVNLFAQFEVNLQPY